MLGEINGVLLHINYHAEIFLLPYVSAMHQPSVSCKRGRVCSTNLRLVIVSLKSFTLVSYKNGFLVHLEHCCSAMTIQMSTQPSLQGESFVPKFKQEMISPSKVPMNSGSFPTYVNTAVIHGFIFYSHVTCL